MSTDPAAYPPARHVIRDLDISTFHLSTDHSVCVAPVTDALRTLDGTVALGFLTAAVDTGAASVALMAAKPDWTATADLALHHAAPLATGPVVVESRLVRAGSNIIVVGVDVFDGEDRAIDDVVDTTALTLAARSIITFARIPSSASKVALTFDPATHLGQWRRMEPGEPPDPSQPLLERVGVRTVDAEAGVVEIDLRPYVSNSFGTLNGGVLGMVFQGAAEASHPGLVAVDAQIHYLSQCKVGPGRTSMVRVRDSDDHAVCSIELVDAGNDDRLLAHATVTLLRR